MLRISKLADYGTVIMNCMAKDPGALLSATEIAHKVHLALPTTSKILKIMVAAHLVVSVRGSGGGYRLSRTPDQITLADVITALDGQPALTECNAMSKKCSQEGLCEVRDNWRLINKVIMTALRSLTLADMTQSIAQHPLITEGIRLPQMLHFKCHPEQMGVLHEESNHSK